MLLVKGVLFVVTTAGLVYVSRTSLRNPRSHGFTRFLAWEVLLVLILLNVDAWFRDPLSWRQLISWCLLLASLFLVIHGVHLLRRLGEPDEGRDGTDLVAFERTTRLVTVGAYRYIRHPLYSSLLFLGWGVFFKAPSPAGAVLAVAATLLLVVTARIEERENARYFGPAYDAYVKRTKMFIPFVF